MKAILCLIISFSASASLVFADGIPVDHETGQVIVPHTILSLTAEQIDEIQTLDTFTLAPEQWRQMRAKMPQCPKRFHNVIPVTWRDCLCCVGNGGPYVIALSRDRIAVLHEIESELSVESIRYELFFDAHTTLRMNERGEFVSCGKLVPFQTLLNAFASPPDKAKRNNEGKLVVARTSSYGEEYFLTRSLYVELPVGAKPTDAVYHTRLKQLASAAEKIGIEHSLFYQEADDSND
jgi:hypothetical protein